MCCFVPSNVRCWWLTCGYLADETPWIVSLRSRSDLIPPTPWIPARTIHYQPLCTTISALFFFTEGLRYRQCKSGSGIRVIKTGGKDAQTFDWPKDRRKRKEEPKLKSAHTLKYVRYCSTVIIYIILQKNCDERDVMYGERGSVCAEDVLINCELECWRMRMRNLWLDVWDARGKYDEESPYAQRE